MSNSEQPTLRIYTAGAIRDDGEYTNWRRSIETGLDGLEFYHPEGFAHEHGGFSVNGAVSEDMAGIRAADGVVAYLTETPQTGTITEILHAVHNDTPTLVLVKDSVDGDGIISGMVTGNDDDYEGQKLRYPAEIEPLSVRGHARDYWFLINYLAGDSDLENVDTSMKGDVDGGLPGAIKRWTGVREATVMAVPDTPDNVKMAVRSWIETEFGVDAASSAI